MIERIRKFREKIDLTSPNKDDFVKIHQLNCLTFLAIYVLITLISLIFRGVVQNPDLNITMFYILGSFLVARYTSGYIFGFFYAVLSVLTVNLLFTYPFNNVNLTLEGYPLTFGTMLGVSIATSALTTKMKKQARMLAKQEKELVEAQKEKMRANLLRAISHDIRTPLTGIIGNSTSYLDMEKELSDDEKRALVENIADDSNWLLNMVENLLMVTRINNETARVNKTLESVDEVVSSAIVKFKKRFPDTHVKVILPDKPVMVMMDALLVEQVLINILQNAKMHAGSKKPFEVVVREDGDNVFFSVKDYGIGIEESRIESIFDGEGAYKKEAGPDGSKGMGIGLSICKTIVLAHGGKIRAKNHGGGSIFIFSLPKETEE